MTPATDVTARRDNSRRRPKGYAPWRPQAKAQATIEAVKSVLVEYQDHLPLTVRQIFYRLVGAHGYPKTDQAYNALADMLVRARRARMIDFDAIRDDGVVTVPRHQYGSVEDFHDETADRIRGYRRDRLEGQPVRLELWAEAAGMIHQLDRVASRYSAPVYSAGGFGSLTANYEIARRALDRTVPTVLLHVGDFDPSGVSIFEAATEDAALFVEQDRVIENLEIRPVRVALTADQVDEFDLPTAPPKKSDGRSAGWKGETCQLEALAPDQLAEIITAAIEDHLDLGIYRQVLAQEDLDRAELLALPSGEVDR